MQDDLLKFGPSGLIGPEGIFHIDSWTRAPINLVTHGHSDHARGGSDEYWCTPETAEIIKLRLGADLKIRTLAYCEKVNISKPHPHSEPIWISFHPAGHILGSAQIRVERAGQVWVFTGDYKRNPDPTCRPFEVVPCDTLITEATFALPIYHWASMDETIREIYDWWQWCKTEKTTALLFAYSLGKSQRILAELMAYTDEEVLVHGAVENITAIYRANGIPMLPTCRVGEKGGQAQTSGKDYAGRLVIAPPGAHRSPWMKRFKEVSTGFCSGWMAVRGIRRRKGYERGFVVSDHADWAGLTRTVLETGAGRVLVTHGGSETLARYLNEVCGIKAEALRAVYGESED